MKRCACSLPMLLLAGCVVGPNYKRPAVPAPDVYRGATTPASTASFGGQPDQRDNSDLRINVVRIGAHPNREQRAE